MNKKYLGLFKKNIKSFMFFVLLFIVIISIILILYSKKNVLSNIDTNEGLDCATCVWKGNSSAIEVKDFNSCQVAGGKITHGELLMCDYLGKTFKNEIKLFDKNGKQFEPITK